MPDAPEAPPTHPETVTAYNPDGSKIELPPEQAAAAFQAGKVGFAAGDRVNVRLTDGRVGSVPGSGLAGALGHGAQLISPADARQHEIQQKYGGALGTAEAAGLGLLRGGTFGLSDIGVNALGGSEAAEALKELHPIASGIGEAGGMIGLGIATGGSSALEEAAEGAAVRGLGEGTAAKLGTHALTGAAEGAYLGGADAVSEDALSGGDHQLTAEKLFASMGENALFGAGLGAAGAALGAGAGAVGRRIGKLFEAAPSAADIEGVAKAQYGYVPKGLGDALVKIQSGLAGGGEDIIREAGVQNQSAAAKAIRSDLLDIDAARDDAARDVVDHVNTMLKDGKDLADEARGALKRGHLSSTVSKEDPAAIGEHSATTIGSVRTQIQSMIGDTETFGQERLLGRMDRELGRVEERIGAAAKSGDTAEQYALLDDAKRAIGSWTRDVKATSLRASTDPVALRQSRATFDELDKLYEGLRGNLENEGVWGKAAADQRKINEAWSAQIAADKQFKSTLAAAVGEERFGGKVYAADPAKIARYVTSLTNPEQDLVHKAITTYVQKTRDLVDAVGTSYDLPAAKVAQVARAKGAAEAFDKTLSTIGDKLAKANQVKALLSQEGTGSMAGAILGHVLGGPAGGVLGMVGSQLASPGRNIMRLAQIERAMGRVDRQVEGSVASFFDRTRTGARALKAAARKPLVAAEDVAGALHAGKDTLVEHGKETAKESIRERFARRDREVRELSGAPTALADRMAPHVSAVQASAPKTAQALGAVSAKAAGYLASQRPTPPPADALTGKAGVPPLSEQERFVRVTQTVLHPETALEDLARGRLATDQVRALQAVYPSFYGQIRAKVQQTMVEHAAAGQPIPYPERVQLGTLFDIEADPDMAPPATAHAQATFAMPPSRTPRKPGPSSKPMPVADSSRTEAERIEGGPQG